ncbi:MAG: hypothetical protein B7Y31_06895, partial [Novosphingobium sp. 16-62-11]
RLRDGLPQRDGAALLCVEARSGAGAASAATGATADAAAIPPNASIPRRSICVFAMFLSLDLSFS